MRKPQKKLSWWWISLIILACAVAIFAGYYFGLKNEDTEPLETEVIIEKEKEVLQIKEVETEDEEETIPEKEIVIQKIQIKEITPTVATKEDNDCEEIETQIIEFFNYLNKKNYVKYLDKDRNTFARFKRIINKLALEPPMPVGERSSPNSMNKNIFYLFRILSFDDIQLLKQIMRNEADTLEINMDLFYNWLTLGEQCPENRRNRPPKEVLLRYAGFFMNTIGGRSYFYRRPPETRILLTYYCLRIINEADKTGENSYGLDIAPLIAPLLKEISTLEEFRFQDDYIQNLLELQAYYNKRRG